MKLLTFCVLHSRINQLRYKKSLNLTKMQEKKLNFRMFLRKLNSYYKAALIAANKIQVVPFSVVMKKNIKKKNSILLE